MLGPRVAGLEVVALAEALSATPGDSAAECDYHYLRNRTQGDSATGRNVLSPDLLVAGGGNKVDSYSYQKTL